MTRRAAIGYVRAMLNRRRLAAFSLALTLVFVAACPSPRPSPSNPALVGGWTDTARTVLATLSWCVPAARAIVAAVVPEPARAVVDRALLALSDASTRFNDALDAYDARGGDQCAAHAAVGGLHSAIVSLASVLADAGLGLGNTIGRVADSVGSIADVLTPRCASDAGWSSAGDRVNSQLAAVERNASRRGIVLRRDLDNLSPQQ